MANIIIGVVTSILIVIIAIVAKVPNYHINPIFLIPFLWLPYFFRNKLHLHPVHYAMFAIAILFHDLGAFGFYQHSPLPWSFDIYVHFYFAVALTLMLYRAIATNFPLKPWHAKLTTLMFMMGIGALHEIMEYLTYLVVGEEKSMLHPSTSYFFDTQRDLTNNLRGALTALTIITVYEAVAARRSARRASPPRTAALASEG